MKIMEGRTTTNSNKMSVQIEISVSRSVVDVFYDSATRRTDATKVKS